MAKEGIFYCAGGVPECLVPSPRASFGAWLEEDYLVQQDDIPEEGTDDEGELIDPEARRKMLVRPICDL